MDVLHHHLESVEAPGLRNLNFCAEPLSKVFKYNSIRGGKEGEDVLDEVLLVLGKLLPVLGILSQVDLVDSPEAGHLVFVHFPDIFVLDRQNNKSVGVVLKQRFRQSTLSLANCACLRRGGHILVRHNLRASSSIGAMMFVHQLR